MNTTEIPTSSSRKKRHGRSARRRRNKVRAIRESVQSLLLSGGGDGSFSCSHGAENNAEIEGSVEGGGDSTTSCLPTDRNRSLPGVMVRRQQYNNNNHDNDSNANIICGQECQGSNSTVACGNGADVGFSTKDELMLTSQLGFVPGNSISIVSRVRDVEDVYPNLFKLLSKPISVEKEGDVAASGSASGDYPTVLQLYPLAIRDAYRGGKSDGRKFKSRKRGHDQVSKNLMNDSECEHDSNQGSNSRNETTDRTTKATTNDGKDDKNNSDCDEQNINNNSNETKNRINKESTSTTTTIEPFPTMYWLTHPYLKILISQLEIEPTNNVKAMEQKLSSCQNSLKAMVRAHESYGEQRWELLTDHDKRDMEERRWVNALNNNRGVAGIATFHSVKCLHAHAAHYLANYGLQRNSMRRGGDLAENLVGRWVLEAVEELVINGGKMKTTSANVDVGDIE